MATGYGAQHGQPDQGNQAAGRDRERLRTTQLQEPVPPAETELVDRQPDEQVGALTHDRHVQAPPQQVPLWFLGVYGLLIAAVPITATPHARYGARVLAALVLLIAVGSVADRSAGLAWAGWVTAALVWLFCHQLGYAWRSWELGGGRWPSGWRSSGPGWPGWSG